jgi:hypothetical protein
MSRHHSEPGISIEISHHKNQRDFSEISAWNMTHRVIYWRYYMLFYIIIDFFNIIIRILVWSADV